MAAIDVIDIRPSDLEIIQAILRRHVSDCEVWAFGSRVHWTAQDRSDLDLAIRSISPIPANIMSALRDDFSESDLLMKVDVLDMASVDEKFRKLIEEEYSVIQKREEGGGWKSTTLGDLCAVNPDKRGIDWPHSVIQYIDISSVGSGFFNTPPCELSLDEAPSRAQRLVEAGDTIISTVRPNRRSFFFLRCPPPNTVVSTGFCVLRAREGKVDPRFLYYLVTQQSFTDYLVSRAEGSAYPAVNPSVFEEAEIRVPPLSEQRAIARILGTLDDKIEANRKMNTTLESIAQALFQSWFVDFDPVRAKSEGRNLGLPRQIADLFPSEFEDSSLGPIPKGWEASNLSDICSLNPLRSLRQGEIAPYLDMKNMPTLGPGPNEVVNRKFTSGSRFENGDTLLARITPCLENGKAAYVQHLADRQVGWGSTEFIVLRPHSPIPPVFAYYLARSDRFRSFAIQRMTGSSGRQRVDSSSLSSFSLAIPPDEIFIEFGKLLSSAMTISHANTQNSKPLSQVRDSLLPKLLSGKLRVKV